MPGLRYDIEDVVADGDRVFAAYTLRTTSTTGRSPCAA